jgi:hypothetical protein
MWSIRNRVTKVIYYTVDTEIKAMTELRSYENMDKEYNCFVENTYEIFNPKEYRTCLLKELLNNEK